LQLFEESLKMLSELQSPDAKVAERSIARVREKLEKKQQQQQMKKTSSN